MAEQGVVGGEVGLIPAPCPRGGGLEGILTGVRILACVNLAVDDRKARTKLLCFRNSFKAHLNIFSVML